MANRKPLVVSDGGIAELSSADNLYLLSTASITVSTADTAFTIEQAGTGLALRINDVAGDTSPFVVDAAGKVGIGIDAPEVKLHWRGSGTAIDSDGILVENIINNLNSASLVFKKARGTFDVPVTASNGDRLGVITAYGYAGTFGVDGLYLPAARISFEATGAVVTTGLPGRIVFSTADTGETVVSERMRISANGNLGIGRAASTHKVEIDVGATSGYIRVYDSLVNAVDFGIDNGRATIRSGAGVRAFCIDTSGRVAIGDVAPVSGTTVYVNKNPSGATTAYGFYLNVDIQSDATVAAAGYRSEVGTQAATFTLPNLRQFNAAQGTFGAGSTVTNQYGFFAGSTLIGATNNYGFYSDIASATGRWNFYSSGTAPNYFAGDTSFAAEVSVTSGLTIGRKDVTAPAATDGNVYSGTYTPTLTNGANVAASTAYSCQYLRVGDTVVVSGAVSIDATAAATDTSLNMSLPIPSAITAGRQLGGVGAASAAGFYGDSVAILGDATTDEAEFRCRSASAGNVSYYFSFTYQVL